jgi:NAD(P)-dependent dehydrogenase (short-subunit alcohol dehydrogenase family)|tara:strand:- start:4569 stop:5417 length:849 start_codon:yes stop_codon:yes gene_type:complete
MKNIVITGVSTGIGYATALRLSKAGYRVFGSVRSEVDAKRVKSELGENYYPLIFDVTDTDRIKEAAECVSQLVGDNGIDVLINNSGIALGGPVLELPVDVFRKQFEVNVFGVIAVTQVFSKLLGAYKEASHNGKIIMISSVAGKRSYPFVGPYSASKHAVEGMSDALRRELMLYDIDVILVEPGPVKTDIWKKTPDLENNIFLKSDFEPALRRFNDMIKIFEKKGLDADVIANRIEKIINSNSPKTRYVLSPNKLRDHILPGLLPDRWLDRAMSKVLGLKKG